jgi:hypothetical protein
MEYELTRYPLADNPIKYCQRCSVCPEQEIMTCVRYDELTCSGSPSKGTSRWRYVTNDSILAIGRYLFDRKSAIYFIEDSAVKVLSNMESVPDSHSIATFEFHWEYSQYVHGEVEIVRVDLSRGVIFSAESSDHRMRLTQLSSLTVR